MTGLVEFGGKMGKFTCGVVSAALVFASAQTATAHTSATYVTIPTYRGPVAPPHNSGPASLYLRCDGNPSIMGDTERLARLVGAITLLGLFAPQHEIPDPTQRLFGTNGVDACNQLIDGALQPVKIEPENNGLRRIPLILARAAHQIEAKNYDAAIADVHKARDEAIALHLIGNPYFDRSMGLSFDQLEAIALVRKGDGAAARDISLRGIVRMPYYPIALVSGDDYAWANLQSNAAADAFDDAQTRLFQARGPYQAVCLEKRGRFTDAAALWEAMRQRMTDLNPDKAPNQFSASAAIAHAMAGQWDLAQTRADEARKGIDDADAAGKPDPAKGAIVEQLDFFQLLLLAHDGKIDDARRNFAARSEWTYVSQGAVWAEVAALRQGARPEQLSGTLAKSRDELFAENRQKALALSLQSDTDNKSLFNHIIGYPKIEEYEKLSKSVWNTANGDILADKNWQNTKYWMLSAASLPTNWGITRTDALLLHAALQAKSRGQGFVYFLLSNNPSYSLVMFGNAGDPSMSRQFYLDPDAVIAELRQVIPSPDELAARATQRPK